MHIVKARRYPNNEIRLTHYYRAEKKEAEEAPATLARTPEQSDTATAPKEEVPADSDSPLDISSDFAKSSVSKERKRTKFGTNAKRTLLRLGGAYDTIDSTPENYIFLTGTLPGGTHEAFKAIADYAPYITRSIADWLRQTCPTDYWFYVWELQRRGALHIHYCLHAPNPGIADKILSEWMEKWKSILHEVGKKAGCDMWLRKDGSHHRDGESVLQAYAQKVRKSVAAYLAGYCGGAKDKHSADSNSPYYPSRWWGCSRKSTKLLKSLTEEVSVEYPSYREARKNLLLHYENALHDTPTAYMYEHKVGVGATVVSYHPEDKGNKLWQGHQAMLYQRESHPNIVSMIVQLRDVHSRIVSFLQGCKKPTASYLARLYVSLEDSIFPATQRGYTLSRRDLEKMLNIESSWNSPTWEVQLPENARQPLVLLQRRLRANLAQMQWDRHGYLCNFRDLPDTVDDFAFIRQGSTTDSEERSQSGEAANGSLSPQTSPPQPSQLCLSLDS